MCDICRAIKKLPQRVALDYIGRAMQNSTPKGRDHLSDLLDEVLKTEEAERDLEAEEAWQERRYG